MPLFYFFIETLLFVSCTFSTHSGKGEEMNRRAYSYHYVSLDSTVLYAQRALNNADANNAVVAEACNHIAFAAVMRMDYAQAKSWLKRIYSSSDHQVELLIADIQMMRICQRQSHNKDFYVYREQAQKRMERLSEESGRLDSHSLHRLNYALSEYAIVSSTYFYYVGLLPQSREALADIRPDALLTEDTIQAINYLYMMGSGGMVEADTPDEVAAREREYLHEAFRLANAMGQTFWKANIQEAMSEQLLSEDVGKSMQLAQDALRLFETYGDPYQVAAAHRTLATCHLALHDYQAALQELELAIGVDTVISQAPDLEASIREKMSVAWAGLGNKMGSDKQRNLYLDIQEETRQDRFLESRADALRQSSRQLNILLVGIVGLIPLVLIILFGSKRIRRRRERRLETSVFSMPKAEWEQQLRAQDAAMEEETVQLHEEQQAATLRLKRQRRLLVENQAKVSYIYSFLPLIDRLIRELRKPAGHTGTSLTASDDDRKPSGTASEKSYAQELVDAINDSNRFLASWIQFRKGELTLKIETFSLKEVFEVISRSRGSFFQSQVELLVEPTDYRVKADKTLTLFMLNTLADNARKFTPAGGRVRVYAKATDSYVEISVEDTGCGMNEEQCSQVFDHHVSNGHGFGLMNCKGIVDKYRKTSSIFSCCTLGVESSVGQGSRFYFRLPHVSPTSTHHAVFPSMKSQVIAPMLAVLLCIAVSSAPIALCADTKVSNPSSDARSNSHIEQEFLHRAAAWADSAYYSNVRGNYADAVASADTAITALNHYHRLCWPGSLDTLSLRVTSRVQMAELAWLADSLPIDFQVILDLRNETAVAALALNDWELYEYNNHIYTQLFKELSKDHSLETYCRDMQRQKTNKNTALVLLVLLLGAIPVAYFLVVSQSLRSLIRQYKQRLRDSEQARNQALTRMELEQDKLRLLQAEEAKLHVFNNILDNSLSAFKHETMYYPSRIHTELQAKEKNMSVLTELTSYYRDLCFTLAEQSARQLKSVRLTLHPMECFGQQVFADAVLLDYLLELLAQLNHQSELKNVTAITGDDGYVRFRIPFESSPEDSSDVRSLAKFLICRQIVREHGDVANRQACSLNWEDGQMTLVLPKPFK